MVGIFLLNESHITTFFFASYLKLQNSALDQSHLDDSPRRTKNSSNLSDKYFNVTPFRLILDLDSPRENGILLLVGMIRLEDSILAIIPVQRRHELILARLELSLVLRTQEIG